MGGKSKQAPAKKNEKSECTGTSGKKMKSSKAKNPSSALAKILMGNEGWHIADPEQIGIEGDSLDGFTGLEEFVMDDDMAKALDEQNFDEFNNDDENEGLDDFDDADDIKELPVNKKRKAEQSIDNVNKQSKKAKKEQKKGGDDVLPKAELEQKSAEESKKDNSAKQKTAAELKKEYKEALKRERQEKRQKQKEAKKLLAKKQEQEQAEKVNDGESQEQEKNAASTVRDETVARVSELMHSGIAQTAWGSISVHPLIRANLARLGFEKPTPIQSAAFLAAVEKGKDVMGAAETGSGKTLAFGLPVVHRLLLEIEKKTGEPLKDVCGPKEKYFDGTQALILTPTRELGIQVRDHIRAILVGTSLRVEAIVGGISQQKQERILRSKPEIVVATPGRLWALLGKSINCSQLHFLVVDEADRMIAQGHFAELESILDYLSPESRKKRDEEELSRIEELPEALRADAKAKLAQREEAYKGLEKRQTFVFSATLDGVEPEGASKFTGHKHETREEINKRREEEARAKKLNKNIFDQGTATMRKLLKAMDFRRKVEYIDLTTSKKTAEAITEYRLKLTNNEKDAFLCDFVLSHPTEPAIVFANSITMVRRLQPLLSILGIKAYGLHGGMTQRQRLNEVDLFAFGKKRNAKNQQTAETASEKKPVDGETNTAKPNDDSQVESADGSESGKAADNVLKPSHSKPAIVHEATPRILVTTDVAARGIDIPQVSHVIHYSAPLSAEAYVHRTGRTGRAGRAGTSILLESPDDLLRIKKIFANLSRPLPPSFPTDYSFKEYREALVIAKKIDQIVHGMKKEQAQQKWDEIEDELDVGDFDDIDDIDDIEDEPKKAKAKADVDEIGTEEVIPVNRYTVNRELVALRKELHEVLASVKRAKSVSLPLSVLRQQQEAAREAEGADSTERVRRMGRIPQIAATARGFTTVQGMTLDSINKVISELQAGKEYEKESARRMNKRNRNKMRSLAAPKKKTKGSRK